MHCVAYRIDVLYDFQLIFVKVKVKVFCCKPDVALGVPGG
jgi:hypothetical protein